MSLLTNDIWPASRENTIWVHTRLFLKLRNFDWTDRDSRWEVQWLLEVFVGMTGGRADGILRQLGGIDFLF